MEPVISSRADGRSGRGIIGVGSFFAEKRTDTNNPSSFPGKNDELTLDFQNVTPDFQNDEPTPDFPPRRNCRDPCSNEIIEAQ